MIDEFLEFIAYVFYCALKLTVISVFLPLLPFYVVYRWWQERKWN